MKKSRKIILISSLVIVSTAITYFGSVFFGVLSINNFYFHRRNSDVSILENDPYYLLQKTRDDFDNLSIRTEVEFKHNKQKLTGYYYSTDNPNGVVIVAHGVGSLADGDLAQLQSYFLDQNWDVFSFDMIGCGKSEGNGIQGLYESRYCVGSAIDFIQSYEPSRYLPICLVGHSYGGFGVVGATMDFDVSAVASFSAYNQPKEAMYEMAVHNAGFFAALTKPAYELSVSMLDGDKSSFKAEYGVKYNPNVPFIIVHGEDDNVVPFKHSLYSNVENDNYDNATLVKLDNFKHAGSWRSKEAIDYYENDLLIKYQELSKQYKNNIPDDILDDFINSVDKNKSSELNLSLLNQINDLFLESVNK